MPYEFPLCQIVPLPDNQVSLQIDGVERTRWHFDARYPRPFFYPFNGPSGETLTRMGHPGAPNHDHHRSVWWAHAKVDGENYWGDETKTRIRQTQWLAYADGDAEAMMATRAGWFNAAGKEILQQEMVASVRPAPEGETFLELQSTFTPIDKPVTFEQSNFGVLAVRVAHGVATYWGDGKITSSEGTEGEPQIFGQSAAWMDYTGAVPRRVKGKRVAITEGITYFDHAKNPSYPSHWHVREDGWMGASLCRHEAIVIKKEKPLRVRYLLHAHSGAVNPAIAGRIAKLFDASPAFEVTKAKRKHRHFEVRRVG
ncbi:MAG TPA: hypothetical protein EYQ62_06440 [Verrucomicrobiales bacterium]|nr:hypothetical protein [Verrucomicrobiales bacterium]